jgi:uncharacterized protein (TIGR03437 family)
MVVVCDRAITTPHELERFLRAIEVQWRLGEKQNGNLYGSRMVKAIRITRWGAVVALPMLFSHLTTAQSAGNWTRQIPTTFPSARSFHAMAYDSAHGQVVLFGGNVVLSSGNAGSVFSDTWTWDGSTWTQKSPQNSPPALSSHAMAYDSARGQVVLFGGLNSIGISGDTWVWDGLNWTKKSPQHSPSARSTHAMAYDSAHGQIVLFGGYDGKVRSDTWTWDGSDWTQKSPQNNPSVRIYHAMAYDSAHGQTVLFGGGPTSVDALKDTWVWDGASWTQKFPQNSPSSRLFTGMAYDSAHSQTVMFGGLGFAALGINPLNDTWIWDGSNWTQKSPQNSPLARHYHAVAYDSVHGQVVLFGGHNGVTNLNFGDTWNWDGGSGGKTPQINTGGIVNNASYNLGSDGSSVAPGSIAAIFGSNLTDGSSCLPPTCNPMFGSNARLNTTMAGAQVTVGGTSVPIFYATPTQLGIQIPFELMGAPLQVIVSVAGLSSTAATANVATVAPGIFTYTADGKGDGAITHVDGSAVTTQTPAQPGELVILYATGLGPVMPAVPTGALPAGTSSSVSQVMLSIGGIGVIPDFAGLAGCCVGLNQINARVPAGVSRGNAVPVVLNISGKSSNTATIAVQ